MRDENMSIILVDVGHKEDCEVNFSDIYFYKMREDIFAYETSVADELMPKPGTFRSSV